MDIKVATSLSTLLTVLIVSACSTVQADKIVTEADNEFALLQNYALTMCIVEEYGESEVVEDAIKAMSGYREFSSAPLEAFPDLYDFYKQWDPKKFYGSKDGGNIEIAKCIDFSRSPDLRTHILQVLKK